MFISAPNVFITLQLSKIDALLDENRLNWAWHLVNTRCIFYESAEHALVDSATGGDTIAVIPMLDFLNHSTKPQVNLQVFFLFAFMRSFLVRRSF